MAAVSRTSSPCERLFLLDKHLGLPVQFGAISVRIDNMCILDNSLSIKFSRCWLPPMGPYPLYDQPKKNHIQTIESFCESQLNTSQKLVQLVFKGSPPLPQEFMGSQTIYTHYESLDLALSHMQISHLEITPSLAREAVDQLVACGVMSATNRANFEPILQKFETSLRLAKEALQMNRLKPTSLSSTR